jgi:hypothetical protein
LCESIGEEEVLNLATKIGVQAKIDGVTRAQFENILSSLELVEDSKASLLVTAAFAHRQAARLGGRRMAELINDAMRKLYDANCGKEDARKLLGFAKWIFESIEEVRLPQVAVRSLTLKDFLDILRRGVSAQL